jgi:hypothetical protein
MKELLFDILPIDFVLEKSKNYLNKNYQYLIGELKRNAQYAIYEHYLIKLESLAIENKIEDSPINWYFLDVLRSLKLNLPDVNKGKLILTLFKKVALGDNEIGFLDYCFESNGFVYNIPLNLVDKLELKYGNYKIFNNISSYEAWDSSFIKALEIVRSVNLQLLYDINPLVKNISVIESQGESHGSMSPKSIMGSVFLPEIDDSTLIAECFIHECLHQYLYRLEHVSNLFENTDGIDELYYSPWKDEPRPLIMVLHGAFVFTGVIMFYIELSKKDLPTKYINTFKERIVYRYTQVNLALNVLSNNNKFTKFGNDILDILRSYVDEIGNSEYLDNSTQIDNVLEHFSKFSKKDYKHVTI